MVDPNTVSREYDLAKPQAPTSNEPSILSIEPGGPFARATEAQFYHLQTSEMLVVVL